MASDKLFNIPYRSKLTEQIEPGQTLILRGKTLDESKRFNINLHKDTPDFSGNDVPLHVSVRFDEGKLVFNTFSKAEWGKEERQKLPIKKGESFDIRIRAHDSKFTVSFNRKEVKVFEHRIPLQHVTHLSIDGDVILNHVQWGGKYYPRPLDMNFVESRRKALKKGATAPPPPVMVCGHCGAQVITPKSSPVPYESGIAGEGLTPGKSLLIYGVPEKKAKKFNINLLMKNGDISLHLNPRFNEKAKKAPFICGKIKPGTVVRNALILGAWGNEEREGKMPFEKGVGFDLEIKNEEHAYQLIVNGERFASFAHRCEPRDIVGLQIQGDVDISGIQIV